MKLRSQNGQSMTEYLILTALIGVGSMAVVQTLGKNLNAKLATIANVLAGQSDKTIKGEAVKRDQYDKKDLGDFSDAISNTGE